MVGAWFGKCWLMCRSLQHCRHTFLALYLHFTFFRPNNTNATSFTSPNSLNTGSTALISVFGCNCCTPLTTTDSNCSRQLLPLITSTTSDTWTSVPPQLSYDPFCLSILLHSLHTFKAGNRNPEHTNIPSLWPLCLTQLPTDFLLFTRNSHSDHWINSRKYCTGIARVSQRPTVSNANV